MRRRVLLAALLVWIAVIMGGCAVLSDGMTTEGGEPSATAVPFIEGLPSTEEVSASSVLGEMLGSRSESLEIVALLTVLSLLPSILIMFTGFVRIVIVLSFVRNALGTQSMPPNQVVVALALFLTFMVMWPVFQEINAQAYTPYVNGEIEQEEAIAIALTPVREFMLHQTTKEDIAVFAAMARFEMREDVREVPNYVLIPAFLTSEIKTAFIMGFYIYVPFLVIDMVVASTLMAMGMMMLPPVIISLPFKILYFVLVDGWLNIVTSVVGSFKW